MPYSKISADLTEEQIVGLEQQIASMRQALNFLVDLNPTDRVKLLKMGDKRLSFVEEMVEMARAHRQHLPMNFDLAEFEKDYRAAKGLHRLLISLKALVESMDDTAMACGSEALETAFVAYNHFKTAKGNASLDDNMKQVGQRFKFSRPKTAPANDVVEEDEEVVPASPSPVA